MPKWLPNLVLYQTVFCVYQSRVCLWENSSPVEARNTKFGREVQSILVKLIIVLGGNWSSPSRWNLTWNSNLTSFCACPHDNSSPVQAKTTKFGQQMQNPVVKILINFWVDWPWFSRSNSTFKSQNSSCPVWRSKCKFTTTRENYIIGMGNLYLPKPLHGLDCFTLHYDFTKVWVCSLGFN